MCHPIFHHFGITSDTTLTPCCLCYRVQAPHSLTLVHVSHAQTFLPTQCSYVRVCVCVCMSLTVLFSHDHPHSLPFTWVSLTLLTITSVPSHTHSSQSPQSPHTPHNHLSHFTHTQSSPYSLSHTAGVLVWDTTTSSCALFQQKKCFFTNLNSLICNIHIFHAPYTLYS